MKNLLGGGMTDIGAINLCEAIIKSARSDYIATYVHHTVDGKPSDVVRQRIERWFFSPQFETLTMGKLDPQACLESCKQQGEYEKWRNITGCKSCKRRSCVHYDGGHYTAKRECEERGCK